MEIGGPDYLTYDEIVDIVAKALDEALASCGEHRICQQDVSLGRVEDCLRLHAATHTGSLGCSLWSIKKR